MQPIIRRNKNKSNLTDAYKAFGPQRSNNAVKLQARMFLLQFHTSQQTDSLLYCSTQTINKSIQAA